LSDAAADKHEEPTLATELQPPPFEGERHATIYVINLYAVKNRSGVTSEEMFQSEIVEAVPDILGEDDRAMREISRAFYRNFTFYKSDKLDSGFPRIDSNNGDDYLLTVNTG